MSTPGNYLLESSIQRMGSAGSGWIKELKGVVLDDGDDDNSFCRRRLRVMTRNPSGGCLWMPPLCGVQITLSPCPMYTWSASVSLIHELDQTTSQYIAKDGGRDVYYPDTDIQTRLSESERQTHDNRLLDHKN